MKREADHEKFENDAKIMSQIKKRPSEGEISPTKKLAQDVEKVLLGPTPASFASTRILHESIQDGRVIISAQHPDVTIPSETLIEGDWRTATNTLVDTLVSREEQLTMTLRGKSSLQGVSRKRFPPKYAAAITSYILTKYQKTSRSFVRQQIGNHLNQARQTKKRKERVGKEAEMEAEKEEDLEELYCQINKLFRREADDDEPSF